MDKSKTRFQLIEDFNFMLLGIKNSEEISSLIKSKYSIKDINSCHLLCSEVAKLCEQVEKQRLLHNDSMIKHNQCKKEVDEECLRFRRLGRFLFKKDVEAKELLKLDYPIPSAFNDWYSLVLSMWNTSLQNSDCANKLKKMGFTESYLTAIIAKTESIPNLLQSSRECFESHEESVNLLTHKFDEMMEFYTSIQNFLIDQFAKNRTDLLELTGIVDVYSHH